MQHRITRRTTIAAIPVLLAATAVGAGLFSRSAPKDLDLSLDKPTEAHLYIAEIAPVETPVEVGPMHAWTVELADAKGNPVSNARIAVDGGMPQHGHGLPTAPAVTQDFGDGRYLVEGMRFNMGGWWEIDLRIDGPAGSDSVTFNLVL